MKLLKTIIGSKLKLYSVIIITFILILAGLSGYYTINTYKKLYSDYSIAVSNNKAYIAQNDFYKDESIVFKKTIEELNNSKDSIENKLIESKKELKIKDSKIVSMQYYKDSYNKTDTIIITDTVFNTGVNIDTILSEKYYKLGLHLEYPNKIIHNVSFHNEKEVFVSLKRETVKTPSKFFLFRIFQKKHDVAIVNIKDSNPYLEKGKSVFIQVIDK